MVDVPAVGESDAAVKRRGHYQVSARLAKVLTLLASGEAKTQVEACAAAGLSPRALQKAMKRPNVRAYLQEVVTRSLGLTAARAAKRMDELLHSTNEMVSFQASRFALGAGAGVTMPERSGPLVNIQMGSGFQIDLREPHEMGQPLSVRDAAVVEARGGGAAGVVLYGGAPSPVPVTIDAVAEPVEVGGDDEPDGDGPPAAA
jgi:hypothetical protein